MDYNMYDGYANTHHYGEPIPEPMVKYISHMLCFWGSAYDIEYKSSTTFVEELIKLVHNDPQVKIDICQAVLYCDTIPPFTETCFCKKYVDMVYDTVPKFMSVCEVSE